MLQQNELVTLLIACGVLIFIFANAGRLRRMPGWPLFFAAFGCFVGGWGLTVLEGFLWEQVLNVLEHVCYGAAAVLLACWVWLVFAAESRDRPRPGRSASAGKNKSSGPCEGDR